MKQVVYSACYGGFGLSKQALDMYEDITGEKYAVYSGSRHDKALVQVVEDLGSELASGRFANLQIATVDNRYRIDEYDGFESVETPESIDWIE